MILIISYRIEHAFDEILGLNISQKNCSYCTKIISAINIHNRAIKLVSHLYLFCHQIF